MSKENAKGLVWCELIGYCRGLVEAHTTLRASEEQQRALLKHIGETIREEFAKCGVGRRR